MALYTVLEPPGGKPENAAFVKEGFAVFALVFTVLWALWHRMWVVAALLFAASTALTAAVNLDALAPAMASLLQFGLALIFGFEARRLQVMSLQRAGYRLAGLVEASGLEAAERLYFAGRGSAPSAQPAPPPAAAPRRPAAGSEDTLGIFGNV